MPARPAQGMNDYVATFHTHLAALKTHRALSGAGLATRMAPVPRKLSSSCGTCVFYRAPDERQPLLDGDTEALYRQDGAKYILLKEFE